MRARQERYDEKPDWHMMCLIEAHRRKESRDERQDSRDRIDYTSQAAGYQDQKHLKRRVE